MSVKDIQSQDEQKKFMAYSGISVLYFAKQGCPHCEHFGFELQQIADSYSSVQCGRIEVSNKKFDTSSFKGFPTIYVLKNGNVVQKITGYKQDQVRSIVYDLIHKSKY